MKTAFRSLIVTAVSLMFAASLLAADENKAQKKPGKGQRGAAALFKLPQEVQLTAEQQAKVKELAAQFGPRMADLAAKEKAIVTPEQLKARQEAMRKAKEAGKKGKDAKAEVEAALKISAKQKQQLAEINKSKQALQQEARDALMSLLSEEQKAKLPKKGDKKPKEKAV